MIEVYQVECKHFDYCNSCYPPPKRTPKVQYMVTFHHNPHQSMTVRLCKKCLNDLGCQIATILDPAPPSHWKKPTVKRNPLPVSFAESAPGGTDNDC